MASQGWLFSEHLHEAYWYAERHTPGLFSTTDNLLALPLVVSSSERKHFTETSGHQNAAYAIPK